MTTFAERVLAHVKEMPEGFVSSGISLRALGEPASVNRALARLCMEGRLWRLARGHYVTPRQTRFGLVPPPVPKVMQSLSDLWDVRIVPGVGTAANRLGLTQGVPIRYVFLTSGRSRWLTCGGHRVELRHAPGWLVSIPGKAGECVRGLSFLGPGLGPERAHLVQGLLVEGDRQAIRSCAGLPPWIREALSGPA